MTQDDRTPKTSDPAPKTSDAGPLQPDDHTANLETEHSRAEIEQEKLANDRLLREANQAEMRNPNDQPGFLDGRRGGHDGEDRQGDPSAGDAGGEERGGVGTEGRSGGIDGGPPRERDL